MKNLGFEPLKSDPCVYIKFNSEIRIIVAIYVDDLFIFTKDIIEAEKFCDELSKKVRVKKLGLAKKMLGIEIERNNDVTFIHQESYINMILEKFNMDQCKPVKTPISNPEIKEEDKKEFNQKLYMEAIGSLLYVSTNTRPDIAYTISVLSQKTKSPSMYDWKRVKRVFRYLKATANVGIAYSISKDMKIDSYSDADFANCKETRRSRTGIIVNLANAPIMWLSKRQPIIALSTVESEYIAGSATTQETIYAKSLLEELKIFTPIPTLHMDNQGAIAISENPVHQGRTKHIDVKYHYIREKVSRNEIKIAYVPSELQKADFMTKVLSEKVFKDQLILNNIIRNPISKDEQVIKLRGSVDDDKPEDGEADAAMKKVSTKGKETEASKISTTIEAVAR